MIFFSTNSVVLTNEEHIGQGNKVSGTDTKLGVDHVPNQVPRFLWLRKGRNCTLKGTDNLSSNEACTPKPNSKFDLKSNTHKFVHGFSSLLFLKCMHAQEVLNVQGWPQLCQCKSEHKKTKKHSNMSSMTMSLGKHTLEDCSFTNTLLSINVSPITIAPK